MENGIVSGKSYYTAPEYGVIREYGTNIQTKCEYK